MDPFKQDLPLDSVFDDVVFLGENEVSESHYDGSVYSFHSNQVPTTSSQSVDFDGNAVEISAPVEPAEAMEEEDEIVYMDEEELDREDDIPVSYHNALVLNEVCLFCTSAL